MKKLFAALLTLCMVFGMAVPAFAAGDPLTIRFYCGGADYVRYKEGWIDVGNIDTGAGRFYAAINFGDECGQLQLLRCAPQGSELPLPRQRIQPARDHRVCRMGGERRKRRV